MTAAAARLLLRRPRAGRGFHAREAIEKGSGGSLAGWGVESGDGDGVDGGRERWTRRWGGARGR